MNKMVKGMPAMRKVFLGCLVLMLLQSESAAAPPLRVDNLRAARAPKMPWTVKKDGFAVRVTPTDRSADTMRSRWTLAVEMLGLPAGTTLQGVATSTPGVTMTHVVGTSSFSVTVDAPRECPPFPRREPVQVELTITQKGATRTVSTEIDHRCLVGDVIYSIDAKTNARVAESYLHDPLIDDLAERASKLPRLSPEEEVQRLRTWIGFSPSSVKKDPPDSAEAWPGGTGYILSPTETARLGGDCEDFSILVSTFLARRGFNAEIAEAGGHVWVRVISSGKTSHLDLTSDLGTPRPDTITVGTFHQLDWKH